MLGITLLSCRLFCLFILSFLFGFILWIICNLRHFHCIVLLRNAISFITTTRMNMLFDSTIKIRKFSVISFYLFLLFSSIVPIASEVTRFLFAAVVVFDISHFCLSPSMITLCSLFICCSLCVCVDDYFSFFLCI